MVLVVAHRGYSGKYPENTILALKKAVEAGADGVEFDIRATQDSKLVVFHDEGLKRMCGVKGSISKLKYSEVQHLKAHGEPIPLLKDTLQYLASTDLKFIILEVKVEDYEEELLEIVWGAKLQDRVIISSYYKSVLMKIRSLDTEIRLAYVMDNRPDRWRTLRTLTKDVELFSVHPFHHRTISTSLFMSQAKASGLHVLAWCLLGYKDLNRMKKLRKLGVDGIITDFPEEVRDFLKTPDEPVRPLHRRILRMK